jgi:hypothetical protein
VLFYACSVDLQQIGDHTAASYLHQKSVKRSSDVLFYAHSVDLRQIGVHTASCKLFTPKQCKNTFGGVILSS